MVVDPEEQDDDFAVDIRATSGPKMIVSMPVMMAAPP
jgi:hypothetical protein